MESRTSRPTQQRADALPALPPGVIPEPRAAADPPVPPAAAAYRHRRTALLVALSAVIAIGAGAVVLGSIGPDAPAPAAPESGVARSAEDVGFLRTVRQQPAFAAISDDSLVTIGHMLCGQLQGGVHPDDIALGSTTALSIEDVSTAVGAAAGAYCPDQIGRVGTSS